jgi:hypothetical protein
MSQTGRYATKCHKREDTLQNVTSVKIRYKMSQMGRYATKCHKREDTLQNVLNGK